MLKKLFGRKEKPINSYQDFWNWFVKNERKFFKAINNHQNIEEGFFNKLSPKLAELKDGFYFLAGMLKDEIAELVITPDGNVANIVFVEELVAAAPKLPNWKFTALKPELDIENVGITMGDFRYTKENLFFCPVMNKNYPDEIIIDVVHQNYSEENHAQIGQGIFIFLDNYLGELNFVTLIDRANIIGKAEAKDDLIEIGKLKSYLKWRQKEFIEKYEKAHFDTKDNEYGLFEANTKNNKPMLASINRSILEWEESAANPWILNISIKYPDTEKNGLPEKATNEEMYKIEDDLVEQLEKIPFQYYVGRMTSENVREIFFAGRDFRESSKMVYHFIQKYDGNLELDYSIYKDKYWKTFAGFRGIV